MWGVLYDFVYTIVMLMEICVLTHINVNNFLLCEINFQWAIFLLPNLHKTTFLIIFFIYILEKTQIFSYKTSSFSLRPLNTSNNNFQIYTKLECRIAFERHCYNGINSRTNCENGRSVALRSSTLTKQFRGLDYVMFRMKNRYRCR